MPLNYPIVTTETIEPRTRAQVDEAVVIASFFALLTGAIEVLVKSVRIFGLGRIIGVSPDYPWMTPLAYALFFVPAALVLATLFRLARRAPTRPNVAAGFAFLGGLALLLPYSQLAAAAQVLLAGGVAVQVRRSVMRNEPRAMVTMRRAVLILGASTVVAGVSIRSWRWIAARREVAALPPSTHGSPNVLLVIFDTVRRANVSLYGYHRPTTRRITQWAKDAVVFDHAIAPAPWTLPTHATMFTGVRPGGLKADWLKPLPDDGPATLAEILRSHGYQTGGFVANHFYTSWESGLERGFVHYDDYQLSLRLILANAAYGRSNFFNEVTNNRTLPGLYFALRHFSLQRAIRPSYIPRLSSEVTEAFLEWQRTTGDRPFFAFVNYMGAHRPYRVREPWGTMFASIPKRRTDGYDAAIARLDDEFGRMLDTLQKRGVLDNTLVILASDHGELFGEHGLVEHGNSLYRQLIEVPLVMRFPSGIPAGRRVGAMVTLRDVGATVLDVAGFTDTFPGASLARYWRDPVVADTDVAILSELQKAINGGSLFRNSRAGLASLMDSRFHYIRGDEGVEELFEYRVDPEERHNVAGDPALRGELERLRRQLVSARAEGRAMGGSATVR